MRMRGTRGKAEYVHAHKSLHHTARCRGAGLGVRVESCRLVKQSLSVCRGTAQTTGQAAQGHQRRAWRQAGPHGPTHPAVHSTGGTSPCARARPVLCTPRECALHFVHVQHWQRALRGTL